ncbi:ATP-dependent RNA helicase dbp-10 [Pleurostoma richardsiae]|uniref:RNA helicase n=1 Tax=Pleurostoma richardsiae TaxID=41990 RepID=A0AA38R8I4_9PEZI|nr:ATP-dependent RNA helicase dbp-10 [Pleurostoma richardsiae]
MPGRAASPALSENEVDIFDSLYADGVDDNGRNNAKATEDDFDFLNGPDGDGNEEEDGDEAYIALKQAASFRKSSNLKGKTVKKGGGFQAMGLNSHLLRAITRKGFSVPTPIQRKAIPLILDRKDVVGMARTGSGKTAAFVIPMIERLRAHSARVGARALILSPSRELALQTLKVVKEFGKGTDLKCVLLVGGDSLEDQFGFMTSNPDIIIATPGRFLHLKVEMAMDLSSIKYVVFDEADRLFEMGFAAQLSEILHALPPSRQTLLFSATLPSSLVEFAKAGLQDPSLVRLDAESKVSPDLETAFFPVKGAEKEGALLHILNDVIKMPIGVPESSREQEKEQHSKKRKRGHDNPNPKEKPTEHSTIVFAATKHHVEYLAAVLRHYGFAVSYVYGALDQTARKIQVEDFRHGRTNILVVTDVAARGIDIPVLANVINYDFPAQPKIFVHRVGRTARAGQRGWAYSIVRDTDVPYLLDLQLFLGRRLVLGQEAGESPSYSEDIIVGSLRRPEVEANVEWLSKVLDESADIDALRRVAAKAEKQYLKTRNSASSQSARRSREIMASNGWTQLHPLFREDSADDDTERVRAQMLAQISGFKPQESIFEIGLTRKSAQTGTALIMRKMRDMTSRRKAAKAKADARGAEDEVAPGDAEEESEDDGGFAMEQDGANSSDWDDESEEELEVTVTSNKNQNKTSGSFKDSEIFMSYTPKTVNAAEERGYSVHAGGQGSNFAEAARDVAMDLNNDESKGFGVPTKSKMRWDKKAKKYVATVNDVDGSKGAKMITGESGVKIAASFQSGRFDKWRRAHRLGKLPQVGEAEKNNLVRMPTGNNYKHKMEKAPREADKYRDDYHVRKKRVAEAKEKRIGKYKDGEGSRRELKSAEDVRKGRKIKEQKRAKNARPSRKPRR